MIDFLRLFLLASSRCPRKITSLLIMRRILIGAVDYCYFDPYNGVEIVECGIREREENTLTHVSLSEALC